MLGKGSVDAAAHEAATSPLNDLAPPTEAQRVVGNYKKGTIHINGLDLAIENPAGSRRKPIYPVMQAHYGYVKRTEGHDGDELDVFVKPGTSESYCGPVYVIDQPRADGETFDEHKAMIGWRSRQRAIEAYLSAYQPGWKLGPVTRLSWNEFVEWCRSGDLSEPLSVK